MSIAEMGFLGTILLTVYIGFAVLCWMVLVDGFRWHRNDDETYVCSAFWPLMVAFWIPFGIIILVIKSFSCVFRMIGKSTRRVASRSVKTVSEVK